MGKTTASIKLLSPADGVVHWGDTVTFSVQGTGAISMTGYRDDVQLWFIGLTRGDLDQVLMPSPASGSGSLDVIVELRELVNHRVRTIAETRFQIEGELA